MAAAIPFTPMLIGAGAGALMDKSNPMRGAMLGAVGGSIASPMIGAMTGIGGGLGSAAAAGGSTMATMPSAVMGGADAAGLAAGLPSMEGLASQMPGAMTMPGMMAPQGITSAIQGYNALPIADRFAALTNNGLSGLFKNPANLTGKDMAMRGARGLLQMGMGDPPPQQPMMAPPSMQAPPPRQPPQIPPQMVPMSSRRMIRPRRSY